MDLALVNVALAGYMAGVGWLVELVVYPQFAAIGADRWRRFHKAHSDRITAVVVLPMLAAPAVALALVVQAPAGVPSAALALNLLLPASTLLSTALVFGPLHGRLAGGDEDVAPTPAALRRLRVLNRGRTAAWTAHLAVALWVGSQAT